MARSLVTVVLDIAEGVTTVAPHFPTTANDPHGNIRAVAELLRAIEAGTLSGNVTTSIENAGGDVAIAKIACTRANASGDTVTLEGIVLTEAVDFLRGASDTTCGDNLAAAINAHAVLKNLVVATAATGTITLTMRIPGSTGSNLALTTSDATAFAITLPTTRVNIACTQANAAGNTVTIQGTVLTEGVDFAAAVDDTTTATNLAAAINANATLAALCAAASTAGQVRIYFGQTAAVTVTTDDATAFAITRPAAHGTRSTVTRGRRVHVRGKGLA